MQLFDRTNLDNLDRRDWQLWALAIAMIIVLAVAVALLMYPAIFAIPVTLTGPTMRKVFFGFCFLSLLMTGYLIDRRVAFARLRRQLEEERRRNIELRDQASVNLVQSLPALADFRDRLAMEFRRPVNSREPLSVMIIRLRPSAGLADGGKAATVFGDAVKAMSGKLRGEDSIYRFESGVFGILLPRARGSDASRVVERMKEGLADAAGVNKRFSFDVRMVNYPEQAGAAREMEQMARASFVEGQFEENLT